MNISEINSVQDLLKANETKSNFQVAVEALENVHVLDNLKIIKWLVSNLADFHMEVGAEAPSENAMAWINDAGRLQAVLTILEDIDLPSRDEDEDKEEGDDA